MNDLTSHQSNASRQNSQVIEPLLTIRQVADHLGVCYETARQRVNDGELTCIRRPGCAVRIPLSSLQEYLERYTCHAKQRHPASLNSKTVKTGISGIGVTQGLRAQQIARRLSNA